jgi:hypothetical protein
MRKYNLNEKFFDELNEKSAYWLGFLYADGCVRMKQGKSGELKLKLKHIDSNHIEKFLNDIECNTPIRYGVDNKSEFCYVLVNSNYMIKKLFDLGCVQNKTQKIRLPNIEKKLLSHFIRGYFDGDGSVSPVKNRPNSFVVSICSNKKFVEDVMSFFSYGKIYNEKNYSIWKVNKINDIKNFRDFIYSNKNLTLQRKLDIFNKINEDYKRDYSKTKNKKKYKLINPDKTIIITDDLKTFCVENGIVYSTMSNLSRGIGKTNKGWKCELF